VGASDEGDHDDQGDEQRGDDDAPEAAYDLPL
jgi:hypothetical protein